MASGYPDFEGTKSKLYTVADWSAVQASDKNFRISAGGKTFGQSHSGTYVVPAANTVFIVGMSIGVHADAAADGNSNQMGYGFIKADAVVLAEILCNGGFGITFPKPMVIEGGETLTYQVYCYANHACTIVLNCWGYQV